MVEEQKLKAGSRRDGDGLVDSMAKDMEVAFRREWGQYMGEATLTGAIPYIELLFVAIAQGVVRHLVNNPEALKISEHSLGSDHLHPGPLHSIKHTGTLYDPEE